MKSEAKAHSVGGLADPHFWRRVLAFDTGHQPGAPFRREAIDHNYAAAAIGPRSMASATTDSISLAIIGETLFPIIRKLCQIVSWNL